LQRQKLTPKILIFINYEWGIGIGEMRGMRETRETRETREK